MVLIPAPGHDRVERGGELVGSVADDEPEDGGAVIEVHQQVAGLLDGPGSGRMLVVSRMCTYRLRTSRANKT
jgi:hypothetical protein